MRNEKEQQEMIELLSEQIRIPSVKAAAAPGAPYGAATLEALEHFLQHAEADGFRTVRYAGHAGVIEFGPADSGSIAGICHLDVVPAGEWQEAFQPQVIDGKIIGRGSGDDKGPAVAVYLAMKRLREQGYTPRNRIQLVLGLDEESGSGCMKYYTKHADLPLAAFTADAEFPVIHAEKGMMNFRIRFRGGQAVSDRLRLVGIKAGTRPNVIPGQCELVWETSEGRASETVKGVMGHASMPELAKNAISFAVRQARTKLEEAGLHNAFVDFYEKTIGLSFSGDGLNIKQADEVSGALTFNTGIVNYDGENAELICDIRYPVTADGHQIAEAIDSAVQAEGASFELLSLSPPLYFPKDHPLVSGLEGVYQKLSGSTAEAIAIGGGTYARSVPNTLAYGPSFPGDESLAHQNGEYVLIEKLYDSIAYYEEAFKVLDQSFSKS